MRGHNATVTVTTIKKTAPGSARRMREWDDEQTKRRETKTVQGARCGDGDTSTIYGVHDGGREGDESVIGRGYCFEVVNAAVRGAGSRYCGRDDGVHRERSTVRSIRAFVFVDSIRTSCVVKD